MNMKLSEYEGREISQFSFLSDEDGAACSPTRPPEGTKFVLSYEYYGDHAENWILFVRDGKEVKRVNVVGVGSVTWKEPGQ